MCERPSAKRDQLLSPECCAPLEDNTSLHSFAPLRIRHPENRDLKHRRMRVDDGFDFAGINILAAGNDHVLHAIENVEEAVCILIADVSRPKHSISESEL